MSRYLSHKHKYDLDVTFGFQAVSVWLVGRNGGNGSIEDIPQVLLIEKSW